MAYANNHNYGNFSEATPSHIKERNQYQSIDLMGKEMRFEPIQSDLKEFSGDIVFENRGRLISALGIYMYEYLYICYSGEEDVEFTITVNGRNLLNDESISGSISWDEANRHYVVYLYDLIPYFSDWYVTDLLFNVTIHAEGYNDLSKNHSTYVSYVPDPEGLSISGECYSELSYIIEVSYEYSVHDCNLDFLYENIGDYWNPIYVIPRLDHDYYIEVFAEHRTPMSDVYSYIEEIVLIPARECDITISLYEDAEEGRYYCLFNDGVPLFVDDGSLDGSFAIIKCNAMSYNLNVSISGNLLVDNYPCGHDVSAISLLPFGDIYGGQYNIEATVTDGYNSLSKETVLEIQPIVSYLKPTSMVLEAADGMNNIILLIDGEEVELSNGHNLSLKRKSQDYTVSAQVGVKITTEWEDYSDWSKVTTIMVPARTVGDVNGDGRISISDLVDLIDYLLSGNDSWIQLDQANFDDDGVISIGDVSELIDILISDD